MLQLQGVTRRYNDKVAVSGVDLEIEPGTFVGIIGRSGAGKSTLLRMINRLVEPSEGTIHWDGRDVTGLKGSGLRDWRAQCAMIFQHFNLVDRVDVLTNVLMGRLNYVSTPKSLLRIWSDEERLIALSALQQFDIAHLAAHRADELSGGQQQRVAIARALVQQPRIILADEPIASLDPRNTRSVMDALRRINREYGITVLCNLHSLDIARSYCDRLVGMSAGKIVFRGTPSMLTDMASRDLYGMEADDVIDTDEQAETMPIPGLVSGPVPQSAEAMLRQISA